MRTESSATSLVAFEPPEQKDIFSPLDCDGITDGCQKNIKDPCSPLFNFDKKIIFSPVTETAKDNVTSAQEDKMKFPVKEDISELEWNIEKCLSQIKDTNIRDTILTKQYNRNSVILKKIQEITKRIDAKYNEHKKLIDVSKPTYYSRDLRFEDGMSTVESTCMRTVREACKEISTYFHNEFAKEVNLEVTCDKVQDSSQLWSKAEDIVRNFSSTEIYEALIKNIQHTTENVKELTSNIDLKRDAENLRFKFETGKLKDISAEPTLLKTVCQRIEMAQVDHFKRFIASEKASNEAYELKKQLLTLNGEIDETLKKKFEPRQAELIRKYFQAEIEHGSCVASYNFLQEETKTLSDELKDKEDEISVLMKKYENIQTFDKTVQAKQLIIQKLIQINGSAKSRHREQNADILKLVENKIKNKQQEISEYSEKYKTLCEEEIDLFMKVPIQNLNCIKQPNDERKLVSNMSINRLNPNFHNAGEESLKHCIKKINLPKYSASENIISNVMEIKEDIYMNSEQVDAYEVRGKELADIQIKISNITECLSRLYKEQFEALEPCMKECEVKTSDIMASTLKFKDAAQTWWQQPAQYLVPWLTVDGLNIKQYLDQFTMQGELLKQLRDGDKSATKPT